MLENGKKYSIRHLVLFPLKCAPVWAVAMALTQLGYAVLPALKVLATAAFLNTALAIFAGTVAQSALFPPLFALVGLITYEWLGGNVQNLFMKKVEIGLRQGLRVALVEKQARLSYHQIENKDVWDLLQRMAKEPEVRLKDGYRALLDTISFAINIISLLSIVAMYVWWMAVLLVAACVLMFVVALKGGKEQYGAEQEATIYDRKVKYLQDEVLSSRENVEERALFGYTPKVSKMYEEQFTMSRKIQVKMMVKWMVRSKTLGILTSVAFILIVLSFAGPVTTGAMSVGIFIALMQAISGMINQISWGMSYFGDSIAKNNEYMKELTKTMALEETQGATLPPMRGERMDRLVFDNVRFCYPGTEHAVLDGVSFTLDAGKHYAFVGANGAGKTTITKLITGLYDNYEGSITINGQELRTMPNDRIKGMSVCVFQDFARYQIPLRDNLLLGSIGVEEPAAKLEDSLVSVGLEETIKKLPQGLDTPLGKILEGGQDLSGGEWQRVALARAVLSPASLRILDEPTAALDPMAESQLYRQFERISAGVSTIFISHRLGSTQLADEILVLSDGKIVQQGSHAELHAADGLYAEMFESQRSWYQ